MNVKIKMYSNVDIAFNTNYLVMPNNIDLSNRIDEKRLS